MLLGDAILAPFYPESCRPCVGCDLGDEYRAPFDSDVPVLFVSGSLDVRTPPANVDAIAPGFSRHAHVLVVNTGHDSRELMSGDYRDLVHDEPDFDPIRNDPGFQALTTVIV